MKTVFIYLGKLIRINNWSKATLAHQLLQNARIFITLAILSIIGDILNEKLLIAPFGASCIIMYSLPKSGFSNPLNIIGSYFICSIVGVVFYSLLGNNCWGDSISSKFSSFDNDIYKPYAPPSRCSYYNCHNNKC